MKGTLVAALSLVVALGVAARAADEGARGACVASYCADDAIYQIAPSEAFAASLFEGPTQLGDLLRLGDFGLGGTSPLEGEMIVLDGIAYHASPHGELEVLPPTARTSFAFVKRFHHDRTITLPAVGSLDELGRTLDAALPSRNTFYAARITGTIGYLKLRSVARQQKPYAALAEVIRTQNVFDASDVEGTLVGFRFPAYLSGVNASGWHFHFVDRARALGGHVLDLRAGPLPATLDASRSLTLILPDDAAFDATDFTASNDGGAAFGAAVHPAESAGALAPGPAPSSAAR